MMQLDKKKCIHRFDQLRISAIVIQGDELLSALITCECGLQWHPSTEYGRQPLDVIFPLRS